MEYTSYVSTVDGIVGKDVLVPFEGLKEAVSGLGYINILTDKDGVSRAVNLNTGGEYSSFAEAIYEAHTREDFVHKESRFLINFVGGPGSFESYSFSDVSELDASLFKDKIVLIGVTAPDLHDDAIVPTSSGKAMPGVEIHANTLQTMLDGSFLRQENYLMLILSIFLASLLTLFLVNRFNTWVASGVVFILIILYIFLAIKLFDSGIIMNLVYVPLSFVLTEGGVVAYYYILEKKEKKKVIGAFGKYVSPHVVNEILLHPEKLNLGGESKEITVLFSDIRGFTTLSENLSPEELVRLLNEYLTAMTDIIVDGHNGIVDKYIGDAIMAFWGAPLDEKKHARQASLASLEMIEKLKLLREKWKSEGKPEINIGVGLNTGDVVVGNMGSSKRFDYTAMGDAINLGSRLEGLTKEYGVQIIISEMTKKKIGDEFLVRNLDLVAVKGRKEPIEIFELVCGNENASEEQKKLKDNFEKGLEKYFEKKFGDAIQFFKKCGDDKPSKTFIERCENYKKNPPSGDWNGVWVMKSK